MRARRASISVAFCFRRAARRAFFSAVIGRMGMMALAALGFFFGLGMALGYWSSVLLTLAEMVQINSPPAVKLAAALGSYVIRCRASEDLGTEV